MTALLLFITCIHLQPLVSNWIQATSTLSLADYSIAAGSTNGTVFLLGGNVRKRRIMRYLQGTDQFTFTDPAFNIDIYGEAQFWAQKQNIVYMISPSTPSALTTFDMITEQFTSDWRAIPTNVGSSGCLAYAESTNHLFVTGGHDGNAYISTLQALYLPTSQWIQNTSSMLETRAHHACIVNNHKLWVFGGYNGGHMSTNERIDITNLAANAWFPLASSLTKTTRSARAVARNHKVYIIGGRNANNNPHNTVHILDTDTEMITLSSDALAYGVALASPVITGDVISVFGGWIQAANLPTNAWMYYVLPIENVTTTNPSIAPSRSPSVVPTRYPSIIPSKYPSITPTKQPSLIPSKYPSIMPSKYPSLAPTGYPSIIPSKYPSEMPTVYPSTMPSDVPSAQVTNVTQMNTSMVDECSTGGVSISIHFVYELMDDTSVQTVKARLKNISDSIIGNVTSVYRYCIVSTDYMVLLSPNSTAAIDVRICVCDVDIETKLFGIFRVNIEEDFVMILQHETVLDVRINTMLVHVLVSGQNEERSTLIPLPTATEVYVDENIAKLNHYFVYVMIAAFFGALMFGVFLVIWYRQEVVLQSEIQSNSRASESSV